VGARDLFVKTPYSKKEFNNSGVCRQRRTKSIPKQKHQTKRPNNPQPTPPKPKSKYLTFKYLYCN
jgi:hypothetical protein